MFELKTDGNNIKLEFSYFIPYGQSWTSHFSHPCSSEHEKELMYAHLKDAMEAGIIKVREEAYNQGWADKSSKRSKRTWFSCKL